MKRFLLAVVLFGQVLVQGCGEEEQPPWQPCSGKCDGNNGRSGIAPAQRHVLMLHVDGVRQDLFKNMLYAGQLPNFQYLLSHGKISYNVSTVDKSETMKVLQSYLTSRLDTSVVGWWQFSRGDFRFRNFWLDPAEVVNYAVGTQYPVYPTMLDVVASHHRDTSGAILPCAKNPASCDTVVAGFTTARRGVKFQNYGRAYLEGLQATKDHSYHNQARATAEGFLKILERAAQDPNEKLPAVSHLLLAATDEFAHAEGAAGNPNQGQACFGPNTSEEQAFFEVLNDDEKHRYGGDVMRFREIYFSGNDLDFDLWNFRYKFGQVCIDLQPLEEPGTPSAQERYALALIHFDIQLGYIINALRSIRFDEAGNVRYEPQRMLYDYISAGSPVENSLFERTLFFVFGDHGMVNSTHMMGKADAETEQRRAPASKDKPAFIEYLNDALGLNNANPSPDAPPGSQLGIEYSVLPRRLAFPHADNSWQKDPLIKLLTSQAIGWATKFFDDIRAMLVDAQVKKHWWLLFLRHMLVEKAVGELLDPHRQEAIDRIAQLYLQGDQRYVDAEKAANRDFYDSNVRLVYGGGARNNAEIFVPAGAPGTGYTWSRRPTFDEIKRYRGSKEMSLLEALRESPGVGLIFVREENGQIAAGAPLPTTMRIAVLSREPEARGTIFVRKDPATGRLVFKYEVAPDKIDPLGYRESSSLLSGESFAGTYSDWNDLSVFNKHPYHNVVGGIGTYLYSNNPAIGDVLLMHSDDWNFSNNVGGHGGVHRGEKVTMLLVSGPGVGRNRPLMARARYQTQPDGTVIDLRTSPMSLDPLFADDDEVIDAMTQHHPTLLDIAPTALSWLGYSPTVLDEFARDGFEDYLRSWNSTQQHDLVNNIYTVDGLEKVLAEAGLTPDDIRRFHDRLIRLFQFITPCVDDHKGGCTRPLQAPIPDLPDFRDKTIDGNLLILD